MTLATYQAVIPASHGSLSTLRHDVRAWLGRHTHERLPPAIDVDLVLTELIANVIDHTDAEEVELSISVHEGSVQVEVSNDDGAETPVLASEWAGDGERGRGLRVVAALTDQLRLASADGRSTVAAELVAERQPVGEA